MMLGRNKNTVLALAIILSILLFAFTACSGNNAPAESTKSEVPIEQSGLLKVHFIDVGQADSILIQTAKGQTVLIDAGNNNDDTTVINYLKAQNVTKLDAVIATHPHEDHIGGLDKVINTFPVSAVYMPNIATTTKTFQDLIATVRNSGAKRIQAKLGVKLALSDLDAVFIAPTKENYESLNNYSAVLKLTYGKTSMLFMGDAEVESEQEILLQSKLQPKADLLKVGHHGSSSSTNSEFLKIVAPKYAVISVGKGNDYGHPDQKTLFKLAKAGVEVYRTDKMGTIIASSDGITITINK